MVGWWVVGWLVAWLLGCSFARLLACLLGGLPACLLACLQRMQMHFPGATAQLALNMHLLSASEGDLPRFAGQRQSTPARCSSTDTCTDTNIHTYIYIWIHIDTYLYPCTMTVHAHIMYTYYIYIYTYIIYTVHVCIDIGVSLNWTTCLSPLGQPKAGSQQYIPICR